MAVPLPSSQPPRRARSAKNRIMVESSEVNLLVYAYLVEGGHVASATAFREESRLETSPLFSMLRPDLIDIRLEANPTGENIASGPETNESVPSAGSLKRRTTSGKEIQEVRAAARAAMENGTNSSPGHLDKENDLLPETSKTPQGGNAESHGGQRQLPRGELIAYLQRGLLWQEAVQHANSKIHDSCMAEFRLLKPHTCTSAVSRKYLRTLPSGSSRGKQAKAGLGTESEIDRALQSQSQSAMKDLPVFSALRDMHMQEQAPEKPPPKAMLPPAVLPSLYTTSTTSAQEKARVSVVSEDIEMPLMARSEGTISSKARSLLPEDTLPVEIDDSKPGRQDKEEQSKVPRPLNNQRKASQDDGNIATHAREEPSTKPPKDASTSLKPGVERKVSHTDLSPRKPKQQENSTPKTGTLPVSEKAKGKAKEVLEPPRAKEPPRKKFTGFFSDSDEEEGPVIKRRKIMGVEGDTSAKQKKIQTDREKSHTEREKGDETRNPTKTGDKKQKLVLDERRSRQGTPASDKSRSTSTTNKEKRPKPEGMASSRDRSVERERKSTVAQPRKASQTSTSTRTGNEIIDDSEITVKVDNKKKKGGEGKNKNSGKSDINPLLPLTKEGALIWKWKGVHKRVLKVAWSPNLNKLAACSFDGHCGIFDFEETTSPEDTGKLKALAKMPYKCSHRGIESLKPVTDVNWNPEGTLLGTICDDGVARTFTPDGSLNSILTRHAGPIRHLAFNVGANRDEGILVTAGSDGLICTWNLDNGNVKWQLNYHMPNQAYFVDFMDGQIFATCSEDTTIGLCSTKSGNPLMILRGHSDRVLMVRFSPAPRNDTDKSRRLLASASEDKTIRIWDVEGLVAKGAELFASMGGSYNERLAAAKGLESTSSRPQSAGSKPAATRDEPSTDEASDIPCQIMKLEGHDWDVSIVQWDPQGVRIDGKRLLLSASQCNDSEVDEETYKTGHTIRMYDINAKSSAARCMYTLRQHEATINAVAFSPDGSKFASVSDDHTMIIWDSLTGKILRRYETDTQLNDVCWRFDGKQVAIAAEDSSIRTLYVGDL